MPIDTSRTAVGREHRPLWRERAGRVLRARRLAAGLRLADVARRAGLSTQYLSEVERGRKEASSEVLDAACGALGLDLLDLVRAVADELTASGGRHAAGARGQHAAAGTVAGTVVALRMPDATVTALPGRRDPAAGRPLPGGTVTALAA